jgi:hypothetical protein
LPTKEAKLSDDHSPGDARKPYSDRGGPDVRHAETHDVRREQLTNPTGPAPSDPSFVDEIMPSTPGQGGHAEEAVAVADDKRLYNRLNELTSDQLARLAIVQTGTRLEQGGTYLDLNNRGKGPFRALGSHEVSAGERIVAKRDTDFELWNELVGDQHEAEVERPETAPQDV